MTFNYSAMDYYYTVLLKGDFDEVVNKTTQALKTEGFGVITEIDMREKLKEKLGVEFKKYKILGACNPAFAYMALQAEEKIGTMLPCNVLVIDQDNGMIEVAAVNPMASMMAVQNSALEPVALEVTAKLQRVINFLT